MGVTGLGPDPNIARQRVHTRRAVHDDFWRFVRAELNGRAHWGLAVGAWLGGRLAPLAGKPAAIVVTTESRAETVTLANVDLDGAERDYSTAIASLEQFARDERAALDPDTAEVFDVNLTAIDTAIGESRAALKQEPENDLAIASLFEALKRKLSLLQDAVALINEMRKGNTEGAARIVSGLNQ